MSDQPQNDPTIGPPAGASGSQPTRDFPHNLATTPLVRDFSSRPRGAPEAGEGPYAVGAEIARGGMGCVLRAEDRKLGRMVAMKVMRLEAAASDQARSRFVREATVLARLEHPNIVPIHELGWDAEDRLYYTMKLVQGRTLGAVLNGLWAGDPDFISYYTLDRLLTIFRKICDAMSLAHSKGVIHRDLKPENVMVGEFGEVLVMDWGLAKILGDKQQAAEESAQRAEATRPGTGARYRDMAGAELVASAGLTLEGAVMGTPHYMSPEQAQGHIAELDQQSDLFSLGAILYTILTLRPPVEGQTAAEVMENITHGRIAPPITFNPAAITADRQRRTSKAGAIVPSDSHGLPHCPGGRIPPALSAVTMGALAVDKTKRYATVAALAADIEAHQAGFATSAEHAGLFKQLSLLVQRHRREFAVGFVAWLVITGLVVWFVINLRASEKRATRNAEMAMHNERQANKNAELAAKNERTATQNALLAAQNEHKALDEKEAARRSLAAARIALADSAFRNTDLTGMVEALESCPPDLRSQSWHYLDAKRDTSLRTVNIADWKSPSTVMAVPGKPSQFILVGRAAGIGIVDAANSRLVKTLDSGLANANKILAVSGDGKVLAVGADGSRHARLLDINTGAVLHEIDLPVMQLGALTLNRDGSLLVAATKIIANSKSPAFLLDANTGQTRWSFPVYSPFSTFSADGKRLMISSGGLRRHFDLLRIEDGKELNECDLDSSCQALSLDGKLLAVGSHYGDVVLIDAETGALVRRGKLHAGEIGNLAWTADGLLLTSGNEGKFGDQRWVFRLWDPTDFSSLATFFGLKYGGISPWSLNSTSGEVLSVESPPRLRRIPVGREFATSVQTSEQGWSACFLSDTLLLGRKRYGVALYDLSNPGRAVEVPGAPANSTDYAACAVYLPSGLCAFGPHFGRSSLEVRVVSMKGGTAVDKWRHPITEMVRTLDFNQAGERLAAVYLSGNSEILSTTDGKSLLKIPNRLERAAFAGASGNLVGLSRTATPAAEVEYQLIQYDANTGAKLKAVTYRFHVSALAVSPDRKLVAVAGSDQSVHVYDADTLTEKTSFRAHDGEITALAFHPAGSALATAAMDHTVKLWDYANARLLDQFIGLRGAPVCLAFNPSGRLLAVDGQEYTWRVFDVSSSFPQPEKTR